MANGTIPFCLELSQLTTLLLDDSLVVMEKHAQKHLYILNPKMLSQFEGWVKHMRQRWEERFEALDKVLEAEKEKLAKSVE